MYLPIHRAAYKVSALQHTYKRKVKEELYMKTLMSIVIDMQNDFVDGALGTKGSGAGNSRRVLLKKLKIIKGRCSYKRYP